MNYTKELVAKRITKALAANLFSIITGLVIIDPIYREISLILQLAGIISGIYFWWFSPLARKYQVIPFAVYMSAVIAIICFDQGSCFSRMIRDGRNVCMATELVTAAFIYFLISKEESQT